MTKKQPDKKRNIPAKKSRQGRKKATVKKVVKRGRKLRQEKSQHVPRPQNFSLAGCGIEIFYDHLTFIPDFEDKTLTVEYLDKERVCKKCRKIFRIDEALTKRSRK